MSKPAISGRQADGQTAWNRFWGSIVEWSLRMATAGFAIAVMNAQTAKAATFIWPLRPSLRDLAKDLCASPSVRSKIPRQPAFSGDAQSQSGNQSSRLCDSSTALSPSRRGGSAVQNAYQAALLSSRAAAPQLGGAGGPQPSG